MELRAREDMSMAQDLTPALPPLAAALHHRFLSSHCSSCFISLPAQNPQTNPTIPCSTCNSIFYCSLSCHVADILLHSSSGECRLLPSTCYPEVRTALRLLKTLGPPDQRSPRRVGGLLADFGSEIEERIREGAEMMRRARGEENGENEAVLAAVLMNAVEVQVSEDGATGIGVYGPWFSWFNHSCSPNAAYRFELASSTERLGCSDPSNLFRVMPASNEVEPEVWKTWVYRGNNLTHGHQFGPKIVVRSIKTIRKGEEVYITYTDLLQPKAIRQYDLWSKYQFMCCCERCCASPPMYVDFILNSDARSLVGNHQNTSDAVCDELAELFDQTIAGYMSDGDPQACCKKLENMLAGIFEDSTSHESTRITFRLHPLHYLSLSAYIALSSACRILSMNMLATSSGEESTFKAFKMGRAAAAYSLLLAGATHHLFMHEPALVATTTIFWISAGECIISLFRSFCKVELNSASLHYQFNMEEEYYSSMDDCKEISIKFLECISKNLVKSWPYLVGGLPYLENVGSPVNFNWLGTANINPILDGRRSSNSSCLCRECEVTIEACLEEHRNLAQLAICCLIYGRYLAIICWGQQSYFVGKVRNMLHDVKWIKALK